jgi:hypothetical protein
MGWVSTNHRNPDIGGCLMTTEPTRPSPETRAAERVDAGRRAGPDEAPTPEEEALADARELDPDVAEHEEEMQKRGARQEGEGRLP